MENILSDNFSKGIICDYNNCNLSFYTISNLNQKQINELIEKDFIKHMNLDDDIINYIDKDKLIKIYDYSKKDFVVVVQLIDYIFSSIKDNDVNTYQEEFINKIKNTDEKNIKKICFEYARKILLIDKYTNLNYNFPQEFIDANEDIFLPNIENKLYFKDRYYNRELTLDDVINNIDLFQNFPVDSFVLNDRYLEKFVRHFGYGNFHKLFVDYKDVFYHLDDANTIYVFLNCLIFSYDDYKKNFTYTLKKYLINHCIIKKKDTLFKWLKSFDFKIVEKYNNWEEMKEYNDNILLLNDYQRSFIETFGIENIKKFDQESNYFSNQKVNNNQEFDNRFKTFFLFIPKLDIEKYPQKYNISYDDFLEIMANYFVALRIISLGKVDCYDYIKGPFRDKFSYLFIDDKAPDELKEAFYNNEINLELLRNHPEYIPFLTDKKIDKLLKDNINAGIYYDKENSTMRFDFIDYYSKRFGNEKTLKLLAKYEKLFLRLYRIYIDYNDTEEKIEERIRALIYDAIEHNDVNYEYLKDVPEFVKEYPDIFLDLTNVSELSETEKNEILKDYYNKNLKYETVQKYPILAKLLIKKNLLVSFSKNYTDGILDLNSAYITSQSLLELCVKYGRYLECINVFRLYNKIKNNYNMNNIIKNIENFIAKECYNGSFNYSEDDAPEFLKKDYPELFLSEDAPEELKLHFYNEKYDMSFEILKNHPEWLPYLENKSVITPLYRNKPIGYKVDLKHYFELFGKNALKLGIQKPKTVKTMIELSAADLMNFWYDKTGRKFIPDHIVMRNFPDEEADKFLSSISYWSKLMKVESFSCTDEGREAMLKLAYSFGVFDNDKAGFQKLYELLTGIPHTLDFYGYGVFRDIETNIYIDLTELKNAIKEEKLNIDTNEYFINDFYRKNGEDSYVLTINPQQYPKTIRALRKCLEYYEDEFVVLTPKISHQLFGGFKMEYDKDFRDFLLDNLEELYYKYDGYISIIQRQFKEIKALNCNRVLTLDLVIKYVEETAYDNIFIGNEKMAEISSNVGYSQEDFDTLQEIYNYGRMRIFSSIPRIENKFDNYFYEILRLDDPLALAIGTLTDCCQELGNAAESCMEHSMIDSNGRVFVIRDNEGNILSQSWVWRNRNVLCFDNIEIPNKAFRRSYSSKQEFADKIYSIYQKASKELIEEDEKVYKKLLKDGKITQEQYNGLRLRKITVGLGYNDIADSIKNNASENIGKLVRPLPFESLINKNSTYLYTNDSSEQYIIEERLNEEDYDGNTLAVHNDIYTIYDNNNFTSKELKILSKMELLIKKHDDLLIELDEYEDESYLVSYLSDLYGINYTKTKIIMHPNFAIIYEENDEEIRVCELLYILQINNSDKTIDIKNIVLLQLKLAIKQISNGKKINVKKLNNDQKNIFELAMNLNVELDKEKGLVLSK